MASSVESQDLSLRSVDSFGREVGLPRLLAVLDHHQVTATFLVHPSMATPEVVEPIASGGHEIGVLCPGPSAGRDADLADVRVALESALERLDQAGAQPSGHRAVGGTLTWAQIDLLAEYKLRWDSSLMDDDRPYRLQTPHGEIAELPPHGAVDDRTQFDFLQPEQSINLIRRAGRFRELVCGEIAAQQRYGGCVTLTVNPRRSGRAARAAAFGAILSYARGGRGVDRPAG